MPDKIIEIVRLKEQAGLTWNEISDRLNLKKETARSKYRRYKKRTKAPTPEVDGVTASDYIPSEDDVYERAVRGWDQTDDLVRKRSQQTLLFDHGPVAFACVADQHFGDRGTNYKRAFGEAELIANTPGMFVILAGDLVNNFVIGKLTALRMDTRLTISDEIVLLRRYVRILAPKILLHLGGNHEYWTTLLTGIPYFRDVIAEAAPDALYDNDQIDVTVKVGQAEYPGRIRHKWRGSSIYNATHGIERAYKWSHGFLWGVGAHTHESGLIREFNADGQTGLAVVCGSYKREDDYARRLGLPEANNSTAVVIIFSQDGMLGFSNLQLAIDYMRKYYKE